MDSDEFREVMAEFSTGVTVVTGTDAEGGPVGLTANAVTSVSLEPPLILVCMDHGSASLPVFLESGRFTVSILSEAHRELALRFSEEGPESRFRGLELDCSEVGCPRLPGALAWIDCRVWRSFEAGDHTILIGEVLECGRDSDGDARPLVFFRGAFGTLAP